MLPSALARQQASLERARLLGQHRLSLRAKAPAVVPLSGKPPLLVRSMFGTGDNIFSRPILRELMEDHEVWLEARGSAFFHDLIEKGLRIWPRGQPRMRESILAQRSSAAPESARRLFLTYNRDHVARNKSTLLAAQFASAGLVMPDQPDFSLPVPDAWKAKARALIASWDIGSRPLMVYRPIILNTVWRCDSRSPDPVAYAALYRAAREQMNAFTVSIADLKPGREWIVGEEQDADVKLHHGELDFETMAGLFAEADLVFSNPGFATVLAQAVRVPSITVYGGHESSKTTNIVGVHLAPSLFIEPDHPCDCHAFDHPCDKHITIEPAVERIKEFIASGVAPRLRTRGPGDAQKASIRSSAERESGSFRVLIFLTCYVDSPHRARLLDRNIALTRALNPDCDVLVVDSHSPLYQGAGYLIDPKHGEFVPHPHAPGLRAPRMVYSFPDNIGHLSRKGRDGWGRAFCYGLEAAVSGRYDYVVHIEGDSLFRKPVMPIVRQMAADQTNVLSVPVRGTKREERGWVETGLMFFAVPFVRDSEFTRKYDWPNRQVRPTPEVIVHNLCDADLKWADWKALRGDKNQITPGNVVDLDWVTHCWDRDEVYDSFIESVLKPASTPGPEKVSCEPPQPHSFGKNCKSPLGHPPEGLAKLNFGCGTGRHANKIEGWSNYDREIDITAPLPFVDEAAEFIFAEHVIEHVTPREAQRFLKECHRVLAPGGVVRIAVPSADQIMELAGEEYFAFAAKFPDGAQCPTRRGAVDTIINAHGHEGIYSISSLRALIFSAGFDQITICSPGRSDHPELCGVEGHHRVIGEKFNAIETIVVEGTK
jgi:SAM-dependent methyltransferase